VKTESTIRPHAGTTDVLRTHGHVVHAGVKHVAIDVLPREVVTFRTICGKDIVEDECDPADVTPCSWCLRVHRAWVLVSSTHVI
jgi:hypothetical protein